MRRRARLAFPLVVILAAVLPALPPAGAAAPPDPAVPTVVPSEILVVGRAPVAGSGLAPLGADAPLALPEMARRRGVSVTRVRTLAAGPAAGLAFPGGAWTLDLAPGQDPARAAALVAADPAILYAGPNHVLVLDDGPPPPAGATRAAPPDTAAADSLFTPPNDPLFDQQFELVQCRIPEAWERTTGQGILVAAIDTGVLLTHPDLVSRLQVNAAERDGLPGVDDDGNGYVDDVLGYDFTDAPELPGVGDYLQRDPDPTDDHGHGTAVAGIMVAEKGNATGIAGVAPGARILAVRAGFRTSIPTVTGLLQEDDVTAAILYALDRGATVLNLSFGEVADAPLLRFAVAYARSRGALVVASAGNGSDDGPHFPGGYPGTLSVGAVNWQDIRAGFSTYGQDLDLVAPGVSILSTAVTGDYRYNSGTSFSSPMVAGAAALVWSAHPEWSADEVAWALRLTAHRATEGWGPGLGWGRLDAEAAVAAPRPPVVQVEDAVPGAEGIALRGSVSDPGLVSWTLAAAPDSAAVAQGGSGPIPGERVLVSGVPDQTLGGLLGLFAPAPDDAGYWVARLTAVVRGYPPIEERSRFLVTPALTLRDPKLQLQAGDAGWDLVVRWTSGERQQGSAILDPGGSLARSGEETALVQNHAVRLASPLPAGAGVVRLLGRGDASVPYQVLLDTTVTIPDPIRLAAGTKQAPLPAGTPMGHTVDWDRDGLPEVLIESPPVQDVYGDVARYEMSPDGSVAQVGGSNGLYHGIPWDAADADGDGREELIVYRAYGWGVWEASVPGGFPTTQVLGFDSGTSLPLGYAPVDGQILLLAVFDDTLRAYRSDPAQGYRVVGSAEAPGAGRLQARGAWGDFDGDGITDVAVADDSGNLVLFTVTAASGPVWVATVHPLEPLAPSMLAMPRSDAPGMDLLTVEEAPATFDDGADLFRVGIQVRRWRWGAGGPSTLDSLTFAGFSPLRDLQFAAGDGRVILRRGTRYDVVITGGDSLAWGGRIWTSDLPGVDGGVTVAFPGLGADYLWSGSSSPSSIPGEEAALTPLEPATVGGALRIAEAGPFPGGLDLLLAWGPDGCGTPVSISRVSDRFVTRALVPGSFTLRDSLELGETVTYILRSPSCPERDLTVTGRAPDQPAVRWLDPGAVALDLGLPLVASPLPVVSFRRGSSVYPARATEMDAGNRRLVAGTPVPDPDSLVVEGGRYADGYPVGGGSRAAYAIPAPPAAVRPLVLTRVEYRRGAGGAALAVTREGDLPACPLTYVVEPGGYPLPDPGGSWSELELPLPVPLAAGTYTLSARGDCLPTGPAPRGSERSFTVGILVYPNPVAVGEDLILENLPAGTRVRLIDVAGRERAGWTVAGLQDRRPLDGVSPGLYFLRLEGPGGDSMGVKKITVLR